MRCSKVRGNIEAYLGGTLSPGKRKRFDNHLNDCEECRVELQRCTAENSLYRQALASKQFQGTIRNSVLARVPQKREPVLQEAVSKHRAAIWLVPVAAAAQFLIAFWLSGTLMFRTVEPEDTQGGRLVAVSWVRDFKRFRYFNIKGEKGVPGPVHADEHMQVD
jgi:anti-sigma factor RsiW